MEGAKALADDPIARKARIVVVPEFTDLEVGLGEKGLVQFALVTRGEPAHAARPHRGQNAILDALRLVQPLGKLVPADDAEAEREITVNVGQVQGGVKVNVVPDRCRVEVDVRYPPGMSEEEAKERIFALLDEVGLPYETEPIHAVPPVETPPGHAEVEAFLAAAQAKGGRVMTYASDAARLVDLDVPVVLYGPGELETPHRPDEWVDPAKVQRAAEVYRRVLVARREG